MQTVALGIGIGLGVGVVHSIAIACVLLMARTNARSRENDMLDLMRERNDLDRQKVSALRSLGCNVTDDDVEGFIRDLPWGDNAAEYEKTIAAGNIRNFWSWVKSYRNSGL